MVTAFAVSLGRVGFALIGTGAARATAIGFDAVGDTLTNRHIDDEIDVDYFIPIIQDVAEGATKNCAGHGTGRTIEFVDIIAGNTACCSADHSTSCSTGISGLAMFTEMAKVCIDNELSFFDVTGNPVTTLFELMFDRRFEFDIDPGTASGRDINYLISSRHGANTGLMPYPPNLCLHLHCIGIGN
jgi:hypothetical protein